MMTDPLADMLTRIRNASRIERHLVEMPATRLKAAVAQVLKDEGFIYDYHVGKLVESAEGKKFEPTTDFSQPHLVLQLDLKYGPDGERVIRHIARISKPGCRRYARAVELRPVLEGLGIAI